MVFLTAAEVAQEVGVSRQTLWRWRATEQVPAGHRYRGREIIFSSDELDEVREYANRLEPVASKKIEKRKARSR